jgi:hypothetical protein
MRFSVCPTQKNGSILVAILITGFAYFTIKFPCLATPLPQTACEVKTYKLLSALQNTERDYASNSANLMPEHPTIIKLEKERTKLRVLLNETVRHCHPVKLSDTLIVPGKRFGPITKKTTYQDLVDRFGEFRLIDKDFGGAEGEVNLPATHVIFLGLGQSFTVVWTNKQRNAPLQVFTTDSAWKTAEGIQIGLTLPELQKILGEFQVSGMEWDYGNQVIINQRHWKNHFNRLSISISIGVFASDKFPKDYEAVLGDRQISSLNPHWKNLKPYVSGLHLFFE